METVFVSHLTPDQHQKVAKLAGKRCTVFCKMNGKTVEALWDTGAQVSITSKDWLENNFPDLQVKSIQCLLNCGPELDLSAANGTKIKCIGYVETDFRLNSNDTEQQITVPMLVTTNPMECPLIGYNVIQEMVQMNSKTPIAIPNVSLVSSLHDSFCDTEPEQVDSLVKIMKTLNSDDGLTPVKTSKSDIIIPKAQSVIIPCQVNLITTSAKTPVVFEPNILETVQPGLEINQSSHTLKRGSSSKQGIEVHNSSNHDIRIPRRTLLGHVELVRSVTPVEVELKQDSEVTVEQEGTSANTKSDCLTMGQNSVNDDCYVPPVDLGHLTDDQKSIAIQMLKEESESFAKDDDDLGCAEDLQLKINLSNTTYPEVKGHIEDLLNKNCITKSQSPYSSPCVVVRKRCGGLHLCIDYHELNKQTVQDRHPIPWLQETLDNLGGNAWFSTLDQGKAYHQGYVHPSS